MLLLLVLLVSDLAGRIGNNNAYFETVLRL
jgi:hypothetical protein